MSWYSLEKESYRGRNSLELALKKNDLKRFWILKKRLRRTICARVYRRIDDHFLLPVIKKWEIISNPPVSEEIGQYMDYCKGLKFKEEPDYRGLTIFEKFSLENF